MIAIIEMSAISDPKSKNQHVPGAKRRYSLAELLAQCEGGPLTREDHDWLNAPDVGLEISYAAVNEDERGA